MTITMYYQTETAAWQTVKLPSALPCSTVLQTASQQAIQRLKVTGWRKLALVTTVSYPTVTAEKYSPWGGWVPFINSIYKLFNIKVKIKTNNTRYQHNKEASQQSMAAVRYIGYLPIAFCQRNHVMTLIFLRKQKVSYSDSPWLALCQTTCD